MLSEQFITSDLFLIIRLFHQSEEWRAEMIDRMLALFFLSSLLVNIVLDIAKTRASVVHLAARRGD